MTDGYQALHETAALIDLSSRGRIRVTGEDRARLLHAMASNHVTNLVPGTGCYAFFLSAVGRVLADANILCFDDHFLLDTEPETRAFLLEHLDKYIIADDVMVEDVTQTTFALGIEGPTSETVMCANGLPTPRVPLAHAAQSKVTILRAGSTGAPGFRLIGPSGSTPDLAGAHAASEEELKTVRLEHFFPRYGDDITSANLPQETGITDALHFNKGCYLGQEIVERVRSRGHVNRTLVGLRSDNLLQKGEKVSFEGTEVGEVTSAEFSPLLKGVALAYVRINAAKPGTPVSVNGKAAQTAAIKSCRT
jgi:folate-binding protein YgfZ